MTEPTLGDSRIFNVLLVDDEEHESDKIARFDQEPHINLVPVGSLDAAREAAVETFFHLALVDLQLDARDDSNVDGQYFLRELHDSRPACRRVLFTGTSTVHRAAIFKLANPDGPLIHGAIDKGDHAQDWVRWLKQRAEAWKSQHLAIDGLDALKEALMEGLTGEGSFGEVPPVITDEELEHVISTLFTSDRYPVGGAGTGIVRVELEPLPGGESRAVVLLVRLISRDNEGGVNCVLKVAPKSESAAERDRYESFARFRVSAERRAELLGSCLGDTIGAAAYAFAGRSPDEIGDLEGLLERESDQVFPILDKLFDYQSGDLWRVSADADSDDLPSGLGSYFYGAYGLNATDVGGEVVQYLTKRAAEYGLVPRGLEFYASDGDDKLELPADAFYASPLTVQTSYHAGVVHGDLNATNILISDDDRVRLIDFRHANVGPIAIDFAALEASARLAGDLGQAIDGGLLRVLDKERRALLQPWRMPPSQLVPSESQPYWAHVSNHVARLGQDVTGAIPQHEYWATCLLFALRLFKVNELGREKRIRLIPWIAALRWALERPRS